MTHPLEHWLNKKGLTQRAFAARNGLTQATVSRVIRGLRRPTMKTATKIERGTAGAVSLAAITAAAEYMETPSHRKSLSPPPMRKISPRARKISAQAKKRPTIRSIAA